MENPLCCNYQLWQNQTLNLTDTNNFDCEALGQIECHKSDFHDFNISRSSRRPECSTTCTSKQCQIIKSEDRGEQIKKCEAPVVPDYVRILMVTDVCGRRKELQVPAALDLERPKRPRTTFTVKQLETLEREFEDNHFVSEPQRKRLSEYLGLSQTQIKIWFQNRRTKHRRLGETPSASASQSLSPFTPFPSLPFSAYNHRGRCEFDGDGVSEFIKLHPQGPVPMKMSSSVNLDVNNSKLDFPVTYGSSRAGTGAGAGIGARSRPVPVPVPVSVPAQFPFQFQLFPLSLPPAAAAVAAGGAGTFWPRPRPPSLLVHANKAKVKKPSQ